MTRLSLILSLIATGLTACGGGGSSATPVGGFPAATGTFGVVVHDAPLDDLSSFQVAVQAVILHKTDGSTTGNLLPAPKSFNFLDLQDRVALLSFTKEAPGTFDAVEVAIDPASIVARDTAGDLVPVRVIDAHDIDDFDNGASSLSAGGFRTLVIDLDLEDSLEDDPTVVGGLVFDLDIHGDVGNGSHEIDEFRGVVKAVNAAASGFTLTLRAEDAAETGLGQVKVVVENSDTLLDAQGVPFPSAAGFLAALSIGTEVEVDGMLLASGAVDASVARMEDGFGFPVRIEGEILSVAGNSLDLLFTEVEKGESIANPVLSSLGNPGVLTISFSANTPVVGDDTGTQLSTAALVPGVEVDVHFASFQAPMPFAAAAFEVDDDEEAEFEGVITDTSGLPTAFTMVLDFDEPAVIGGLVTGPVVVDLSGSAQIFVDTEQEPTLQALDLLTGLEVKVRGALSGPPNAATLTPDSVEIEPGELRGEVTSFQPGTQSLTVNMEDLSDPFGGPALGALVPAMVPAGAFIEHDGNSLNYNALLALFNGLEDGDEMEIELAGIGDGAGGVIGFEIEVRQP